MDDFRGLLLQTGFLQWINFALRIASFGPWISDIVLVSSFRFRLPARRWGLRWPLRRVMGAMLVFFGLQLFCFLAYEPSRVLLVDMVPGGLRFALFFIIAEFHASWLRTVIVILLSNDAVGGLLIMPCNFLQELADVSVTFHVPARAIVDALASWACIMAVMVFLTVATSLALRFFCFRRVPRSGPEN